MHVILTMLWLALAALFGSGPAFAHAALVESNPADGSVVERAPAAVRLRFGEPVAPLVVSLTDAQGRTHRGLAATSHNETLDITMPPDLPGGIQILSYRVTSGDGHPIGGSVAFTIGAPVGSGPGPAVGGDSPIRPALWLARVALYLGLFIGVGGAFFLAWVPPGPPESKTRRVLACNLAVGAVAAVLSLGLQGLDALGEPLAALTTSGTWAAGWQTSFGWTAAIAFAALLLGWISLPARTRWWRRGCSLAAMAGVGLALAMSGHASTAAPQWVTRPAVFLHAVGVAYWAGALIPLAFTIRQAPARAMPTVRRFSNGALVAVAVLILAGLALAAIQVEVAANLMATTYGQILVAKAAFVVGLLSLASLNRLWLTPRSGDPDRGKWLIRSIMAELALVTVIMALVGLWRFTPPPRALAPVAEAAAAASVHLHTPNLMAQVTLSPGRVGMARAGIVVASGRAEPVSPKEVTLILAKPEAGIEALERRARKAGRDGWDVDGLVLPVPGLWTIKVEILVDDFEKASLDGTIAIRP